MYKAIFFLVFIFLLGSSCQKNTTSSCDPDVSFSKQVKPLIIVKCGKSGCHDDINIPALSDYFVAHDGSAQIKASIQTGRMPLNGTLTSSEKNTIICWIDNGSMNN